MKAVMEQAIHAAHDVFVFAGYIGKVRDWENFAHRWRAIVADNPKLESANTVKALFRWCGPYSDWRAIRLMSAVISDPHLGSIRLKLPYKEYRSVVLTHLLGGKENLYFFAWSSVLP